VVSSFWIRRSQLRQDARLDGYLIVQVGEEMQAQMVRAQFCEGCSGVVAGVEQAFFVGDLAQHGGAQEPGQGV
jgi:hypothetical protein